MVSTHCPYPLYPPTTPEILFPLVELSNKVGKHCVIILLLEPSSLWRHSVIYASFYVVFGLIRDQLLWFTNILIMFKQVTNTNAAQKHRVYCLQVCQRHFFKQILGTTNKCACILQAETFSMMYNLCTMILQLAFSRKKFFLYTMKIEHI